MPMDPVQIKAIVGQMVTDAVDHVEAEILDFAEDADDLYLGNPLGNEVEGRSQVVDRATMDAIEWMIPQFMRMFHGSDQPVAFEPAGPEDEAVAQQATAYVGYIYNRDNDGMAITETVLRSALLYRYGVVKRWWDVRETVAEESLEGMTLDQVTLLLDEPGVTLLEATVAGQREPQALSDGPEVPSEGLQAPSRGMNAAGSLPPVQTGGTALPPQMPPAAMGAPGAGLPPGVPMAPPMAGPVMAGPPPLPGAGPSAAPGMPGMPPAPEPVFDIRIRRTTVTKRECIEAVPANEFLIDRRAKRIADATLVGHRKSMTRSELVSMGYDRAVVAGLPYDDEDLEQDDPFTSTSRRDDQRSTDTAVDDAGRLVSYYELFVRLDEDDDGVTELRRICCAGKNIAQILRDEVVDAAPFEGFTPIMLPHRLVGLSIADLTRDIQIVKTTLWRQMLDGLYLSTSPVTDVATGALDPAIGLDDFLVRRPGGIRRVRAIDGIRESTQQWGGAQAFPMLEYLDSQAEGRTGVSRRSAGLSPDLLNPNVSATASMQMMSAVQARIELIARRFAEGFLKPLFLGILRDVARHQDEVRMVRLNGRFVPMDPRTWNTGMDVTVAVGLGTASQDKRLAMLGQVLAIQQKILMAPGGLGGMVGPTELHNTLEDLVRAGELSGVDRYFAPPKPQQPGPPPPDPAMEKAKAEIAIKGQQAKADQALAQQKAQADAALDQQRAQADITIQRERMALEAQQQAERIASEMALKRWQAEQEIALRREEMAAEIELKRLAIITRPAGIEPSDTNVPRQ
jgi:hypothetical protein